MLSPFTSTTSENTNSYDIRLYLKGAHFLILENIEIMNSISKILHCPCYANVSDVTQFSVCLCDFVDL